MQLTDVVYYKDGGLYWVNSNKRVGCLDREGYRVFSYKRKQYKEHRIIFFIFNGYYPNQADHINGVKDDNRIENIRDADHFQNQYNRNDIVGVRKKRNKYEARISYNGNRIQIGTFNCYTKAVLECIKARNKYYGEWNRINGNV